MVYESPPIGPETADLTLQAYLLGSVEFEAALALQRRLAFQVAGEPRQLALVLCEHPPLITVGRQGSRAHILCEQEELRARRWVIRWVNRGGGCILHGPGQLAIYPVVPLQALGLSLPDYLSRLQAVVQALLGDFDVHGKPCPHRRGIWVKERPVAALGVAVCNWVTYYGVALNVNPDLEPYRRVLLGGAAMTSLERERHGPLRPSLVRERLLEHFVAQFGVARTYLFFDHPALSRKAPTDAVSTAS